MNEEQYRQGVLRSEPFELDLAERRLRRAGRPVELSAQPLLILEILLRAPGRLVARQTLKDALWPGTNRIDTERRLNTAVRALRKALGEDAERPAFLETVRGEGYRWIGAAPARRGFPVRRGWAAAACALLAVSASVPAAFEADAPPIQVDYLKALAVADSDPGAAAARLNALVRRHPGHVPAQLLRAELATNVWRGDPTAANLDAAKATLAAARAATRGDPAFEVLAGELAMYADWNLGEAERRYRQALKHDPTSAKAHRGLAWVYVNSNRFGAARREVDLLLSEASLTPALRADVGWLLLRLNRPDEAAALCDLPGAAHPNLLACRHTALARLGDVRAAREAAVGLLKAVHAPPSVVAAVRHAPAEVGYQRFLDWRVRGFVPADGAWFQKAQLYAEAGRAGDALASLEKAVAARDPNLIKLASTREFAALQDDPRYAAAARAVGLDRG